MADVEYCPCCGESITSQQRAFQEDLVLNRYRTEFECPACGFHGDLFRHEAGDPDPELMTDGGQSERANYRYGCPVCYVDFPDREQAEEHVAGHPGVSPDAVVVR